MPKKCARKERKKKKLQCMSKCTNAICCYGCFAGPNTCTGFKTLMKFLRIIMLNKFLSGISEVQQNFMIITESLKYTITSL